MNIKWIRTKARVKGLFDGPIPYAPLLEDGDSSPYFGTYEGQKYGSFDTSSCWDFSACELAETRLEMLWKLNLIPQETKDWLKTNGYIDKDGDFYLSRRWVAILSGVKNNGNEQIKFWQIASKAGLIPNWMLPYSVDDAFKDSTQDDFNNDYFNPKVITKEMELMGVEFAKRFKIRAENISGGFIKDISVNLQTYLKEGSMQIGHPVPHDGSWNREKVDFIQGYYNADHATELYKFDETQDYPFYDYDSYEPRLKQLSKNYYIPIVTRVSIKPLPVIKPIPLPQFSPWMKFWMNVRAWITNNPLPFPSVPIGSA